MSNDVSDETLRRAGRGGSAFGALDEDMGLARRRVWRRIQEGMEREQRRRRQRRTMWRLLLISTVVLALLLAVLAARSLSGGVGNVHARPLINCTALYAPASTEQVTCDGHIVTITPFRTNAIDFRLVIDAIDNAAQGPSEADQITACTISINGGPAKPTHVDPCP
jgi:hypothetical protein